MYPENIIAVILVILFLAAVSWLVPGLAIKLLTVISQRSNEKSWSAVGSDVPVTVWVISENVLGRVKMYSSTVGEMRKNFASLILIPKGVTRENGLALLFQITSGKDGLRFIGASSELTLEQAMTKMPVITFEEMGRQFGRQIQQLGEIQDEIRKIQKLLRTISS